METARVTGYRTCHKDCFSGISTFLKHNEAAQTQSHASQTRSMGVGYPVLPFLYPAMGKAMRQPKKKHIHSTPTPLLNSNSNRSVNY